LNLELDVGDILGAVDGDHDHTHIQMRVPGPNGESWVVDPTHFLEKRARTFWRAPLPDFLDDAIDWGVHFPAAASEGRAVSIVGREAQRSDVSHRRVQCFDLRTSRGIEIGRKRHRILARCRLRLHARRCAGASVPTRKPYRS